MLKAIHAQEDCQAARTKAQAVVEKLESTKLSQAAAIVRDGVEETLSHIAFPREHWTRIRTNNMLERIMREIRRRTRVVGNFPDGRSALMLVAARLRHIPGTKWGSRPYLEMGRLREQARGSNGLHVRILTDATYLTSLRRVKAPLDEDLPGASRQYLPQMGTGFPRWCYRKRPG